MKKPLATRVAEQALNPLIGKSFVAYATKPHLPVEAAAVDSSDAATVAPSDATTVKPSAAATVDPS
jgi:hypothetical protein